ncbi:plastocyanin/azurin family copper-binding protein [Halorubellus salinus]|uniref:plastocyanin/azurin family copper-binding protein n=1 Tax=Halorubellus salinus TaxID=755309 RepID=UPI001D068322|nr:plastocyanin/azurin family copper-binding protein [Halorubellus salinus]
MTDESLYTRRRMLGLAGTAAAVGLAGCAGTQADTEDESPATDEHHEGDGHSETGGHDDTEEGHDDDESGHGDHSHGHEDGEVGEPTATAEVKMLTQDGSYHFDPHVTRVEVGGTVTFHNESGSHSATAYHPDNDQPQLVPDGAASWDSGILSEEGATLEHTFETEGVYHYYCSPHETMGMIGSVIVGEPEAHGQPALEEPPEGKPESVRKKISELNEMCNEALGHEH